MAKKSKKSNAKCVTCNCSVKGLALAIGILGALCTLILGWSAWLLGYGNVIVGQIATIYIGYSATLLGGIIGAVYAFVDGAIAGAIIAWLYNKFSCCCK